jgi:hypothetical protein
MIYKLIFLSFLCTLLSDVLWPVPHELKPVFWHESCRISVNIMYTIYSARYLVKKSDTIKQEKLIIIYVQHWSNTWIQEFISCKSGVIRCILDFLHHPLNIYICNSTLKINTVQRNHITLIRLLHVSAKLHHHHTEYVKYQMEITEAVY